MSWQAMEAVQDCEAIQDHTALAVMYAITRFMDAAGIAGSGGKDTSPSIDTIAARARCHRNTVLNWLPKLESLGVLLVERFGSGRGSWNRYTLLVPLPANNGTSNGTQDVPKVELMVQGLSEKIDLLVQVMVHNGTTQDVPDTKDTEKKKKEEEYIYIAPDPEPIANIKTAIAKICKQPLWDKTREDYDSAAHVLFGYDATPGTIAGFGQWWKANGYYGGKPSLKSIMDEYQNFLDGVTRRSDNGHVGKNGASGKTIEQLFDQATEELENGVW